jgi:hypothetical protein
MIVHGTTFPVTPTEEAQIMKHLLILYRFAQEIIDTRREGWHLQW